MAGTTQYAYLNLDQDWPGFVLKNLEKGPAGELTLARVPRVVEMLGAGDAQASPGPLPDAPAGLATFGHCACDIYISDPAQSRIWRLDSCESEARAFPCLTGPGDQPGELNTPRGLAIVPHAGGARLYVADSGNHRIQVIALESQQPLGVWGQSGPQGTPAPGSTPGRLNDPWGLAADREGNIYVVDHGNARVQKFTPGGEVVSLFWERMSGEPNAPGKPVNIAIAGQGDAERVYVLDRSGTQVRILVFDTSGKAQPPGAIDATAVPAALALAATTDAVYVGGADGTLAKYSTMGAAMSTATSAGHPIATLVVSCTGELLAGAGGLPIWRWRIDSGYVTAGYFSAGPFETHAHALAWHRWRVLAAPLDPDAHVQLYTYSSTTPNPPPDAGGDNPFASGWFPQPRDVLDALVLSQPVRNSLREGPPADPTQDQDEGKLEQAYFWVGGLLRGNGNSSPVIQQMRIDYTPSTYVRYLPPLYREGVRRRLFLELALAAVGKELGGVEELVAALPRLFDPAAAPPDWLPWLASWLDLDLLEDWSTVETRRNIAGAFALYSMRGTAEGLRRYLKLYAGVEPRVEEPGASVALFALDENISLGLNTVLAPAHEQGAVLASTATLGQSDLLAPDEMGIPLFHDLTHRFSVQVYASQLIGAQTRDRLTAVLEREKPAHTDYHLCVIEAKMRVGFQARVGIDSIVGGPAPDLLLGELRGLGTDTVLANKPERSRQLDQGARVGMTL